jgi:hypothetical protein
LPLSSQAARQLEDLEVFLESKKFEWGCSWLLVLLMGQLKIQQ